MTHAVATKAESKSAPPDVKRAEPHSEPGAPAAGVPLYLQRMAGSADRSVAAVPVQAKVIVNEPGDRFEQEADAVAHLATSGGNHRPVVPSPLEQVDQDESLQRQSSPVSSAAPLESHEDEQLVQTLSEAAPGGTAAVNASRVRPPNNGAPLSERVRERVEPLVGRDLSAVRVHDGPEARETSAALGARAFTSGHHIWLGPGESQQDERLMAHEAAHVVQQAGRGQSPPGVQRLEARSSPARASISEPRPATGSTSDTEAAPEAAAVRPADSARRAEVDETRRSFARGTERSLGLDDEYVENPDRSELGLPERAEERAHATDAMSAIDAASDQLQTALEGGGKAKSQGGPDIPAAAPEPAESIAPEADPSAVAAEINAVQPAMEEMQVPAEEVSGPGVESSAAMSRLRGAENVDPRLVAFGEAVNTRIEALRTRVGANAAQASAQLRGEADAQRAAIQSSIGGSQTTISRIIEGTRGQVATSRSASEETLAQQSEDAHARNAEFADAETARLQENIDRGAEEARTIFSDADAQVAAAGDREAQRGRDYAEDLARRAIEMGRSEAASYRRTEEDADLGEDKAEAVTDVASQFASQLRSDGEHLMSDVREQTAAAQEQITAEEEPTVSGLEQAAPDAADGIRTFLGSVDDGIDMVVEQGDGQLDAAEVGVQGEIDSLDSAAEGRGSALQAEGEANLDAAHAAGVLAQTNLMGQAGQMLDEAGRDTIDQLTEGNAAESPGEPVRVQRQPESDAGVPLPGGIEEEAETALGQLDQMGPALDDAATSQSSELTEPMRSAAMSTDRAGSSWVGETERNMDALAATADAGMTDICEGVGTNLDATLDGGQSQASREVDRISDAVGDNVTQIRDSVDGGVSDATAGLESGVDEGVRHSDETAAELPDAMNQAAQAQEHWYSALGHWISEQLADTWQAFVGIFSLGFVQDLLIGIAAALVVGALVVFVVGTGGLGAILIAGAAAGAAGFAAAQMSANVRNGDPLFQGVGHAAILGAFVGAAGAAATFYGLSLAAGTALVMVAAGVGTVIANVATGRDWDKHLIANILILGIFHAIVKAARGRIPSRRTTPVDTDQETSPYEEPPTGTPEVVVDSPARVVATEFQPTSGGGWICELYDSVTGARYGFAEVEATPEGRPNGGPHLTIDPTNARMPDGSLVSLRARGFSWTTRSLNAAIDAFRNRFGQRPPNMDGLIAWSNLLNFQRAFARIRAANPGMSLRAVAEQAAREISFGTHRISLGYGDISVEFGNFGDVTLPDGTVLTNVPKFVFIHANPTTPGVVVPPPDIEEEEDD